MAFRLVNNRRFGDEFMKINRRAFLLTFTNFSLALTTVCIRKNYGLFENIKLFNKKNVEPITIKGARYQWIVTKDESI